MRAEMLPLGEGKVLHLLPKGTTARTAQALASSINMVRAIGVKAPFVHAVMNREDRTGLVLDMPEGVLYSEWLRSSPSHWDRMVSLFAHEAHEMHLYMAPELRNVKDLLRMPSAPSGLTDDEIERLKGLVRSLPDGESVCNWNYIPQNVVVSYDGPMTMVWDKVRCGPYLADVARTIVLLKMGGEDVLADSFRKEYMKICGRPDEELDSWVAIVAADMMADANGPEMVLLGRTVRRYLDGL